MNCRRAKQLVFEFVDGLTDERVRLELENHLAGCGECEKLASQVVRSMDLVHRAPVEALDDNFNWKVRLAIHKERHAMQENLVSQGVLFRAWNTRYVASAVAGFAMAIAAGWMALSTGVVSMGGGAAVITTQPIVAENTSPSSDVTHRPVQQPNGPVFTNTPAERLVSLPGSAALDRTPTTERSRGALTISTPVDLDSLVQAEMEGHSDVERIDYLQQRIQLLQNHLEETKAHIKE